MSWAGSTVHAVNSNRAQILGKIRLDWFVISLNLEIGLGSSQGFLRVKSAHLYKDGIVSLLRKAMNNEETILVPSISQALGKA